MNHQNKTSKNLFLGSKVIRTSSFAFIAAALVVGGFFSPTSALAAATVYPASEGTNISIDTTSAPGGTATFKTLNGPIIGDNGDIAKGTHTINLPAGWEFDTGSQITITPSNDIGLESTSITPAQTSFSFVVTTQSTAFGSVGFSNIKVRPTGTTPSTGNMTYSGDGIFGVDGSTNFGTLSTVPGVPTQLKITDSATGGNVIPNGQVTSGQSITAYAIEADQFNNFIGNVPATWSLGTKSGGVADGDLVAAGDNKSAVFTGHLVGTATIHAEIGTSSLSANSGVLTVVPGPVDASKSKVTVDSASAVVSNDVDKITVTVIAKDAAGNPIAGADVSVSANGFDNTISPVHSITDANGQAVFTISSTKAQTETVSATIGSTLINQTQNIEFIHDVASQLSIATQPSATAVAGVAFTQQPVINVLDQFGNLVNDDNTTVITAAKHPDADSNVLKGNLTATASGGVATFVGLNYEKAATITIDFTSGTLTPVTSNSITVSPADTASVVFTTQPATVAGDTVDNPLSTQPVVLVQDTYGNNVADGTSIVLSLASGSGVLRGTLTQTTIGGVATFTDIGYSKTDSFTINATAGSVSQVSNSVGPLSAGIIHSFILTAPASVTAGTAFNVNVTGAVDKFGNPASGTVVVSAASGDGNAPDGTSPTYNDVTVGADGTGLASATLVNATPTVLRGTAGSVTADTGSIAVNAAAPSEVVLTSDKTSISANNSDSATITGQLKDEFGNNAPVSGISVVISTDNGAITQNITTTDTNGQVQGILKSDVYPTTVTASISANADTLTIAGTSVTLVDVTAPAAPIVTAPTAEVFTNASTYTITGTAEANSLIQIYSGTNAVASQQLSGGATSFSVETQLALNTANNFTVTAKDAAGNESGATTVATINEDINPSISSYTLDNPVISPNASAGIQDSATFDVAFSEEVNATIDIVDSSGTVVKHIYSSAAVTNPDSKIWDGTNNSSAYVADGIYTIKIVITDKAGNTTTDTSKTITVDNTAPVVSVTGAPTELTVNQSGVTASVACNDSGSGCATNETKYKVYTSDPGATCPTGDLSTYTPGSSVSVTDHSWVCAYSKDNAGNEAFSAPVEFNIFSTIQGAINAAASGATINVAVGTYPEQLNLGGKSLTINGADSNATIIDAQSFTGYAIQNFGNSTTVKNLKLRGTGSSSSSYGFKISHVSNITLENIKVENSYKTGIDLNTVNGATLNNIEVTGTVAGFGLMILDSDNVDVTNVTTNGNAWGGVSVQTKNAVSNLVTFSGVFNAGENFPLLLENDPDSVGNYHSITNVTLPTEFSYIVYAFREGDNYKQWFYFETLDAAKAAAQAFVASVSPVYSGVAVYDIAAENYYVVSGMKIQAAVDAAGAGDTINITEGTYAESVLIEKSLTLVGTGTTKPIVTGLAPANYIVKIDAADDVVIDNLEINGNTTGTDSNGFDYGIWINDSGSEPSPVEIKNSTVKNIWKNGSNGIEADNGSYALIHDNIVSSFHKRGIRFINSEGEVYNNEVVGESVDGTSRVQNLVNLWGGSTVEIYNNTLHGASSLPGTPTWDSPGIFVSSYGGSGASNADIHDNEIYNCDTGIVVGSTYATTDTSSATIAKNNLHDLNWAINFEKSTVSATITKNNFANNTIAINDDDNGMHMAPADVIAEMNWWGSTSGPATGAVFAGLDYRPWCVEPTCATEDRVVPTITTYTPTDNAVGVDPTGNITVTFSEPVTITAADVELKKNGAAEATSVSVAFDSGTNKATIDPDVTLDSNSTYAIKIKTSVADLAGNQLAQEKTWSFTTSGSYNIQLTQGWNLISMPVIPNNTAIENVLGSTAGNIESVWTYDAVNDAWYVYHPTSPSTSNLTSMTAGYGYWINYNNATPATLSGPGNLFLEGNNLPPQRTLKSGWNLIGYYQKPNTESVGATYALKTLINPDTANPWWTMIVGYNNESKQFIEISDQDNFNPGKGYWILMAGRATDTYIYAPGVSQ